MDKRLIATDFDGTIFINGEISGQDREGIKLWRESGRYFGVVTGRGKDFFNKAKEVGLDLDYYILCNGSLIADSDRNIIYSSPIDRELFTQIYRLFMSFDDLQFCSEPDNEVKYQFYSTFPSVERALEAADLVNEKFAGRAAAVVNGTHVNIGNAGTGKAESVYIILKHFGLSAGAAAVVGDDYNDLDMIKEHSGWAVLSGKPAVVSAAPHTCESVGGLALTLLKKNDSEV